jgi:hypothetical protein
MQRLACLATAALVMSLDLRGAHAAIQPGDLFFAGTDAVYDIKGGGDQSQTMPYAFDGDAESGAEAGCGCRVAQREGDDGSALTNQIDQLPITGSSMRDGRAFPRCTRIVAGAASSKWSASFPVITRRMRWLFLNSHEIGNRSKRSSAISLARTGVASARQ